MSTLTFGLAIGLSNPRIALLCCAATLLAAWISGLGRPLTLLVLAPLGSLAGVPWPITATVAGVAAAKHKRREGRQRNRPGSVAAEQVEQSARVHLSVVILIGLLCAALAWVLVTPRFAAHPLVVNMGEPGALVLVLAVVGLAALNATGEELLWRQSLHVLAAEARLPTVVMLVTLSSSFGLAHLHGIPAGAVGVAAAAAFGLLLSGLRLHSGFAAALLVHWFVDLAIFAAAARHMLFLN